MRVYFDNNIASGRVVQDLGPEQMAALCEIELAHDRGVIKRVTSRESWREQERSPEPIRGALHDARAELSVVATDHVVLGFSEISGPLGTVAAYPLVTDIVDAALFADLKAVGLKDADARHLMYAFSNDCVRFVTLDRDFLNRRELLNTRCNPLRIVTTP
jgi:hypothetical protein